jgi:hypothetical protein
VILPGETRLLAKALVPPHFHPQAEKEPLVVTDALAEFAAMKVAQIIDALTLMPEEFMDRLEALEAVSHKPRAGVMQAITKEKLRRAALREQLQDFNAAVAKMDDAGLQAYRANVAAHPELVAAVDAEVQKRAGG